jgi:putative GTP pyrophosphokinase
MIDDLLRAYDAARPRYVHFVDVLESLVVRLLASTPLRVHSVAARVKSRDSLRAKISAAPERYQGLNQITDLAGLRVITYFADDVESVGSLISGKFEVVEAHSSNKRDLLADGEFGYLSLHYVVRLTPEQARLVEYEQSSELLAEVQVRSILQHAWAEIEHDLGYKTPFAIPRRVRREFARLAALLEGADDSFVALRSLLGSYEKELHHQIDTEPDSVQLDVASLRIYLRASAVAAEINSAIVSPQPFLVDNDVIARHVSQLGVLDVSTVGQLDKLLRASKSTIIGLGQQFRAHTTSPGSEVLSLVYLEYLLLLRCGDESIVHEFLKNFAEGFLVRLVAVYKSLGEDG